LPVKQMSTTNCGHRVDMSGYTKLFSTIVNSTIWNEPHEVRLVWITMLATADKNGEVEASVPGLAHLARVTVPECEKALDVLLSPDPYSRTPEYEGRRIEKVTGGWFLLNHGKYRAKMSADERREYNRIKKQEQRNRSKPVNESQTSSMTINDNQQCQHMQRAESESEADAKEESNTSSASPPDPSDKLERCRELVCKWFGRRKSTAWPPKEEKLLLNLLNADEEELELLDWWFSQTKQFEKYGEGPKKGIPAFLNSWVAEVDKARRAKTKASTPSPGPF